ncbi:MAG: iron-containing alcohol dehydrogenase [Verrucomicrobia bacterium]|nr:MAG: iron-containing alcohol dehydrogenase [Verrucomicrobiota bacterium]
MSSPPPLSGFDLTPRTRVVFEPGSLARLGTLARELGGTRALLVTDPGLVAAGHAARAEASLRQAGLAIALYDAVRENPTTVDVAQCVAVAARGGIDLIVGFGGGSSMDTARGTNFLHTNGGEMKDYWGVGKATRPMLPMIAVPTTAGTGSECQSAALIADAVTHQKMACLDPKAAARVALLDPELTLSLPRRVTAVSGIDALSHALETAVTRKRTPVSRIHSTEAFCLAIEALPRVLSAPNDLDARARMQLAAAFAGTAIEQSMLGAVHAAANPLTARFNVVHGAAVGLLLVPVIRYNAAEPLARNAYARLAVAAGLAGTHLPEAAAVEALLEALPPLLEAAGIPATLTRAGVDPASIPDLATDASHQWTANFNPRLIAASDFSRIYESIA